MNRRRRLAIAALLSGGLPALVPASLRGAPRAAQEALRVIDEALAGVLAARVRGERVDYAGLRSDRAALDRCVAAIGDVDAATLGALPTAQALAYWLNAYNALVLRTIVDAYPIRTRTVVGVAYPANSIWQIPGAFREARHRAGGRSVSLDDIEHRIVRPQFGDPRVHVALVCAARSCPPLRGEPYRGDVLGAQLDDQARRFVADPTRGMRIDAADRFAVSSIFKWFAADFASLGAGAERAGIREFVARYVADAGLAARLRAAGARLAWLDYDWTLNE